jgi:hypothetical protein
MTTDIDLYGDRDRRAAELGWVHVSDDSCPCLLVGEKCMNEYTVGRCWCSYVVSQSGFGRNPLNDHGNTWLDHKGVMFVLWEPYGADGDELANLITKKTRALELRVDICESVWNPPHTIGIRFRAEYRADLRRRAAR